MYLIVRHYNTTTIVALSILDQNSRSLLLQPV